MNPRIASRIVAVITVTERSNDLGPTRILYPDVVSRCCGPVEVSCVDFISRPIDCSTLHGDGRAVVGGVVDDRCVPDHTITLIDLDAGVPGIDVGATRDAGKRFL